MGKPRSTAPRAALGSALAIGLWLSAGQPLAAPAPGQFSDLRKNTARAKDVRIELRRWDDQESTERPAASVKATTAWLERLFAAGLTESGRWPDSSCAVACRRCPDQLHVDVTFKSGSRDYFVSLFMREGLAFVRTDSAAAWSIADSRDSVLSLIREALPTDAIAGAWIPSPAPPAPLEPDSAAYREDDVLVTGMPEAIDRPGPNYPSVARESRIQGVVQVRAMVRTDGTVDRVRVAKSVPGLDDAALGAVQRWKFRPATCGGRPVAVWVIVPVRFTLR